MRAASPLLWVALLASSAAAAAGCAADKKKDSVPASVNERVNERVNEPANEPANEPVNEPAASPSAPSPAPTTGGGGDPTLLGAAPTAQGAKKPAPPIAPTQPSRAASMKPGFQKAFTSFQELAAAELGVPVEQVQAGPDSQDVKMPQTLGKAWAYTAIPKDVQAPRQIRGWATADGVVITPKQNLGALLKEAGVGTKKAKKPDEIAKAITWALGNDYSIDLDPWPTATVDKQGAGTFVFAVNGREPGPGGAGGGPVKKLLVTITIAADHSASMAMTAL